MKGVSFSSFKMIYKMFNTAFLCESYCSTYTSIILIITAGTKFIVIASVSDDLTVSECMKTKNMYVIISVRYK